MHEYIYNRVECCLDNNLFINNFVLKLGNRHFNLCPHILNNEQCNVYIYTVYREGERDRGEGERERERRREGERDKERKRECTKQRSIQGMCNGIG